MYVKSTEHVNRKLDIGSVGVLGSCSDKRNLILGMLILEFINFLVIFLRDQNLINVKKKFKNLAEKFYLKLFFKNKFQTKIVNKYGVAYSCDFYPNELVSDIEFIDTKDYEDIYSGSVVYVISSALKDWFNKIYPELLIKNIKIILVTGDSVKSNPLESLEIDKDEFNKIKKEGIIYHWFCQNCDIDSEDYVTPIPVGLDYHTIHKKNYWGEFQTHNIIQDIEMNFLSRNKLGNFNDRKYDLFCDIHLNLNNKSERTIAFQKSKDINNAFFVRERIKRSEYWKKMRLSKFIISPSGVGLDCHRTWEALALGVVPIIKSSNISKIFQELPVLIVDSFDELNDELLRSYKLEENYDLKKITLEFWIDQIKMKKISLNPNLEKNCLITNKKFDKKYSLNFVNYLFNYLSIEIVKNPLLIVLIFITLLRRVYIFRSKIRILKFLKILFL